MACCGMPPSRLWQALRCCNGPAVLILDGLEAIGRDGDCAMGRLRRAVLGCFDELVAREPAPADPAAKLRGAAKPVGRAEQQKQKQRLSSSMQKQQTSHPVVIVGVAEGAYSIDDALARCFSAAKVDGGDTYAFLSALPGCARMPEPSPRCCPWFAGLRAPC